MYASLDLLLINTDGRNKILDGVPIPPGSLPKPLDLESFPFYRDIISVDGCIQYRNLDVE
jgi:hypothetical protein